MHGILDGTTEVVEKFYPAQLNKFLKLVSEMSQTTDEDNKSEMTKEIIK